MMYKNCMYVLVVMVVNDNDAEYELNDWPTQIFE